MWFEDVGENYTYDIRIGDGKTSYKPAGRNATEAEGKRLQIAAKFEARSKAEAAELIVVDPAEQEKKRVRLEDSFCGWCDNCHAGLKGDRLCEEFELHKFRRTCITTWLRNKIDPRTVMEYAGHADLETTLRYLRPAAAHERIAAVSEIKWY